MMQAPDKQFSEEQSRQIAAMIREELARRRMSRQQLADQAKLSISTLEKALGGRRPFTLATAVRLEQALGLSLRKGADNGADKSDETPPTANGEIAPDSLGAYTRRAVSWIEGTYVTVRPSFSEKDSIYAYRTEITWDPAASCLMFHESERQDAAFTQFGEVAVPNQSGHIHLVTNRDGQHRLITVSRPMITGEMYGIITTLLSGRGSLLTPVAAPITLLPIRRVAEPRFGRLVPGEDGYEAYRGALRRVTEEPFALFIATMA
jgi:transcriptional regulator with XRE-family HTH domain